MRVPILYGPVEQPSESAVTTLWNNVKSGKECKMDHRQRRYPTHTSAVADIIKQMTEKHAQQVGSLCHTVAQFSNPHYNPQVEDINYRCSLSLYKFYDRAVTGYMFGLY